MNFLAHAYLSFGYKPVLIGNLISDFVKGKKRFTYPESVQAGISLHRKIDNFTDTHPATAKAVELLRSEAGRYAPVFIDIIYDHFLARDEKEFPGNSLLKFADESYAILSANESILPPKFRQMLPYMISENWFANYRFTKNIERSFNSVFRRASYLPYDPAIFGCFINRYHAFEDCYLHFFPAVKLFAESELEKLDKNILVNFTS